MNPLFPRLFRPYVRRVRFSTVKPGHPFMYRGVSYLKSLESNLAFRITSGETREMCDYFRVRPIVALHYGHPDASVTEKGR